MVQFQLGLFQH